MPLVPLELLIEGAGPDPGLFLRSLSLGPGGQRNQSRNQKRKKHPRGSLCSPVDRAWTPAEDNRASFPCPSKVNPSQVFACLWALGTTWGALSRSMLQRFGPKLWPRAFPRPTRALILPQPKPCHSSVQLFPTGHFPPLIQPPSREVPLGSLAQS